MYKQITGIMPLAKPSTSGISTNKSHDQPSSSTDMANTTRCSVPFCISDFKTNGKSHGISLFKFPKDPNIRREWVKALGVKNWEANSNYIICSEHFKEESLYETKHGRKMLHPDALPIKNLDLDAPAALMVCRICLTVDSNMQHLSKFSEVFNSVTGLLAADSESCRLPQQLCWECAARLKSAASLRRKAWSSDAILRDLLKPDTFIRIRDIKSINRKSCGLKTSLVQKLIDCNHYDVKIQDTFIDTDHIKTEYDLEEGIPELLENVVKNEAITNLKENNSVKSNTKTNNKDLEKKLKILGTCIPIEYISNVCQSDNNITVVLENVKEENNTKHVILQNDDESNIKFGILQNNDKASDLQYAVAQNSNKGNNLKYMMSQNDNCNVTEVPIIQNNDIVTEGKVMSDKAMLKEYVHFDDIDSEMVEESDVFPKEFGEIVHEEHLKELDIGVENVKKPRQNKTVARVTKRKMDNSRAVSGQKKINKEDISVYENLFEIKDLTFQQQREEVFKRQEHESYINAPYKCTVCFTGIMEKAVFDRHTLKHTDTNGKFECTICKIRTKRKSKLNRHLVVSHSREYKCVECDFVTRNSGGARAHVKYHKGKRFECKQCPLVFDKSSTYLSHLRLKHVNPWVCEYCGYTFVSQRGVINHKNLLHRDEKNLECKGPYCKECDVTFLSEVAHNRHLKLSSKHLESDSDPLRIRNEPPHVKKAYKSMTSVSTHRVIKKHNPVTCEQCGEESRNYRSYALHFLRLHPGLSRTQYPKTTPHICELCGKMFATVTSLSYHKWVHTGKKMFQCDHCDKSFSQKATLADHLASVKEGQPKHQCPECGKVFVSANNLKRHERIHTGLPFECDICSRKFETNSRLHQHKQHTHYKIPWPKKVKRKDVNKT